jgi:hypothetical protein
LARDLHFRTSMTLPLGGFPVGHVNLNPAAGSAANGGLNSASSPGSQLNSPAAMAFLSMVGSTVAAAIKEAMNKKEDESKNKKTQTASGPQGEQNPTA